jgi:ribosomal protein L35AE/L33A
MELTKCKIGKRVSFHARTRGDDLMGVGKIVRHHEGLRGVRVEVYCKDLKRHVLVFPSQVNPA